MPVSLSNIRDLMLPGLEAQAKDYMLLKEQWAAKVFNEFNEAFPFVGNIAEPSFTLDEIQEAQDIIAAFTSPDS